MKVLIIGNGGREHALAWKSAQSHQVEKVFVAPGNAGTALENKVTNVDIAATDIDQLLKFAKNEHIDLTIVGPEQPLSAGIVDHFQQAGLPCFGPKRLAAQLETSKSFCKDFLRNNNIPTAHYETFTDVNAAKNYVRQHPLPIVIKADGLAAGKGVIIAQTLQEADHAIEQMLEANSFGQAGHRIVIEEFLTGEELSYIVMCDGQHILPLASSQDHKRRDDGDQGPNTGGMGAFSPSPLLTADLNDKIMQQVIKPTIAGMNKIGTPYVGFLYAGIMVSPTGQPYVLEFNCRMGDPETQPILMRLQSDLIPLCFAALNGTLHEASTQWSPKTALTVVLTAGGYPLQYKKGDVISGLNEKPADDIQIFHAGTLLHNEQVLTNGGRVLGVTALGDTLKQAHDKAYAAAARISWPNCFFRKDIGHRAMAQQAKKHV